MLWINLLKSCALYCGLLIVWLDAILSQEQGEYDPLYGTFVGKLRTLEHAVSGDVYFADANKIVLKDFSYDGQGPDAFFYLGRGNEVSESSGEIIPDENGSTEILNAYNKKNHIIKTSQWKVNKGLHLVIGLVSRIFGQLCRYLLSTV